MITIHKITKVVDLHPKHLDQNVLERLRDTLLSDHKKYSSEEYGVVIGMNTNFRVVSNMVRKDSGILGTTVELEINTIKPAKGMVLELVPSMVIERGLVGNVHDGVVVVFVPLAQMPGWTYNKSTQKMVHEGGRVIDTGTPVTVEITNLRFDTTCFNCIAKLL